MLERATICAENVAQHLLRPVESPLRSSRLLPHTFWKYTRTGDDSTGVAWWPAYLDHLRHAGSSPISHSDRTIRTWANDCYTSGPLGKAQIRNATPRNRRHAARQRSSRHDRAYMRLSGRLQQQAVRRVIEYNPNFDDGNDAFTPVKLKGQGEKGEPEPLAELQMSFESENVSESQEATSTAELTLHNLAPEETLDEALSRDKIVDYEEIWGLYRRLPEKIRFSERMLKHLSSSDRGLDIERAIQLFNDISVANRTEKDYRYAMEAIIMRGDVRLADSVNCEALSRSVGIDSSRVLLTYLIRQELWPEAAKAWNHICASWKMLHPPNQLQVGGTKHNESPVQKWALWADVDAMLDLPRKLAILGQHFDDTQTPFGSGTKRVKWLTSALLTRAFSSTRIMAVLTGDGFLALVDELNKIGICKDKHYIRAISALNALRQTRPRPRLALLVYRNLRHHCPTGKVSERTYGSLLSILAAGGAPAEDLLFVLEEFSSMHGKPDRKAYQLVLSSCARLGNLRSVFKVFKHFCNDYGKPRDLAYITPLLYVHARLGEVKNVQNLLGGLEKDYGLQPDIYCWNILLVAHAQAADPHEAFKTFDEMRRRGIHPDSYSFGTLMGICAANGDTEAVHKLVELARAYHITGTYPMVDTLVESYCNNDEVENAENLAETATMLELEGSPTRMWNIILLHYAYRADYEAVLRTQERMRELSVKPDGITYAALMTTLVIIGKTDDAAKILRSLHLSERLSASLFHYSIILHGYTREGNRDMVTVIYHEIMERFQRPSVSARLSRLHAESQREIKNWQASNLQVRQQNASALAPPTLPRTTELLVNILAETDQVDLASRDPQPGLQRRSPSLAVPMIYIEFVSRTLNLHGAFREATDLLSRCQAVVQSSYLNYRQKAATSIQLLTTYMIGCVRQNFFEPIEEIWQEIMSIAKSRSRHSAADLVLAEADLWRSRPPPMAGGGISVAQSDQFSDPFNPFTRAEDSRVLPSQRYILSRPLSQYLQALRLQGHFSQIPQVVNDLQCHGFALSSKNWNTYIQTLTQSPEAKLKLHAFELFEAKLLPNMPPWHVLLRGSWTAKTMSDQTGWNQVKMAFREKETRPELVPRSLMETFQSTQLLPTYYTLVYLASVLVDFQRRESQGEAVSTRMVRDHAPETYKALMELPYVRDRVQGLLVRERLLQGDSLAQPRQGPRANRSLLLGNASKESYNPQDGADESTVPDSEKSTSNTESNNNKTTVAFVSNTLVGEPSIPSGRSESKTIAEERRQQVLKKWNSAPNELDHLVTSKRAGPIRIPIPSTDSEGRIIQRMASRVRPVGRGSRKERMAMLRAATEEDKQLLIKTIPPRHLSKREVNAFSANKARRTRERELSQLAIAARNMEKRLERVASTRRSVEEHGNPEGNSAPSR